MAPYGALYNRRCRSSFGWFKVGESSLLGLEIMYEAIEKVLIIRYELKTAYSPQKSYADNKRRDLEF